MKELAKKILALTLAFSLGYLPTAYAADIFRFADPSDNSSKGEIDDSGNVTFRSSHTASAYFGDGSNLTGITATTATSLAADPADCAANQFANAIDAEADLTCAAIADADVPNNITIDLAATATALAADPADCGDGFYALGVDASGTAVCSAVSDTDDGVNASTAATSANTLFDHNNDADNHANGIAGNAGTATALAANGANCSAGNYPLGVDASGAAESCTADDDQPDSDAEVPDAITVSGGSVSSSDVTLTQSASPTPTVEGRIEWDTDDDRIVVGDSSGQAVFYSGAHTTDTNANTICAGSTTYLDGEGNCDDISSVYQAADTDLDDLADGALTTTKLDRFQLADTTANICAATPTSTAQIAISTDQYDLFMSTGTGVGDWRNTRTGAGPC